MANSILWSLFWNMGIGHLQVHEWKAIFLKQSRAEQGSLENSWSIGWILQHTVLMSFALSSACLPLQMSQFSPLIYNITINLSNNSLMGWWSLMAWNTVQKLQSPNNRTNGAADPAGRKLPPRNRLQLQMFLFWHTKYESEEVKWVCTSDNFTLTLLQTYFLHSHNL